MPGYRRQLNLQSVHLRGLETDLVEDLLPYTNDATRLHKDPIVANFLHQNALRKVGKADSAGFFPLHYAAISGDPEVIQALLLSRANPNKRTKRDEPLLGYPPFASAMDLAVFYSHNAAARHLIAAKARVHGGIQSAFFWAAAGNNVEGIRLLVNAGGNPWKWNVWGHTALEAATGYGRMAALEEFVAQGEGVPGGPRSLSLALWGSCSCRGGSAKVVNRLLEFKADMDFQVHMQLQGLGFKGGVLGKPIRCITVRFLVGYGGAGLAVQR